MSAKAVYCISSRTTGTDDDSQKYLLMKSNLLEIETKLKVSNKKALNYKEIRTAAQEKISSLTDEGKKQKCQEIIKMTRLDINERDSYFKKNRKLLEELGLNGGVSLLFEKSFYKYNESNDILLYAVKQLESNEAESLISEKILWCEVLINFLRDIDDIKEEDAKEFTLILHDKDIPSDKHSQNSCVAFLGNEDCQKEGLITEDLCIKLTNERVKLNVVFFKHELNCIYKVLTKTDSPKKGLEEALKSLDGFEILKSHAAEVLSFKVKRKEVYE